MKKLIFLSLFTFMAKATTFTLTNDQSGAIFHCDGSGSTSDPQCVAQVRSFCDDQTTMADDECFSKSAVACGNGVDANCVESVFRECDDQTTMGDDECFVQSLSACGGKAEAIKALLHSAAAAKK